MGDELLQAFLVTVDDGPEPGADLAFATGIFVTALRVEHDDALSRLDTGLAAEGENDLLADVEPARLFGIVLLREGANTV